MQRHIHIGYGDSATGCLNEAILNHGLAGDHAIPSRDDFTQGPISECLFPNGLNQRITYWKLVDRELGFRFEPKEFYNKSIKILDDLESDEITIWVGDSCHDILATGWLFAYLEHKNFKWFIVNLAEVKKNDQLKEKPVVNLAMYAPNEISNLYSYRRLLDSDDVKFYTSTWKKAALENSHYRIKEENKIISVDEDYFDAYILDHISSKYETVQSIIGRILKAGKHRISDTSIEWNIRKMIKRGLIDFQGDLDSMSLYSIRKNKI